MCDASAERGGVLAAPGRDPEGGRFLRGGDGELRIRLQMLVHSSALVPEPLRKLVEDRKTEEASTRAAQGTHTHRTHF